MQKRYIVHQFQCKKIEHLRDRGAHRGHVSILHPPLRNARF